MGVDQYCAAYARGEPVSVLEPYLACLPDELQVTSNFRSNAECFVAGNTDSDREVVSYLLHHAFAGHSYSTHSIVEKGVLMNMRWMPGLFIGPENLGEAGPIKDHADVLLLGGYPNASDAVSENSYAQYKRYISASCAKAGISDMNDWYFTNVVKFSPSSYSKETLKLAWLKECRPTLDFEMTRLRPKWVLCFGSAVGKYLLNKSSLSVNDALGEVFDATYTLNDGTQHPIKVMVLPSLLGFRDGASPTQTLSLLDRQLRFFKIERDQERCPETPRHVIVNNIEDLKYEINRVKKLAETDPRRRILAVDMEWEGDYPEQTGAHLLTLQFSSAPKEATVVVLHSEETGDFQPNIGAAVKVLNSFLTHSKDWRPRVGGHFLRADLPWLMKLGIVGTEAGKDIRYSYAPTNKLEKCKDEGGWDTSVMYHAYREKEAYGLKYLAVKELGIPRWETQLNDFLDNYRKENKLRKKDIHGYGCIPDSILHPYAAWDADATRRLVELCMFGYSGRTALLDDDGFGNSCWEAYWRAHRASLAFLEIEQTGLLVDTDRFFKLSSLFAEAYAVLLYKFRETVNWPDFNPASVPQCQGVLFGPQYGYKQLTTGERVSVVPEDAKCLYLPPQYATQNKKAWSDVLAEELDDADMAGDDFVTADGSTPYGGNYSPSADKQVLNLLAQTNADAALLRDIKILAHNLSRPLSKRKECLIDGNRYVTYPNGLYPDIHEDGKIHTKMSQLKSTGRASSSKPPLQNIGKSVEAGLQRILGVADSEGEHGDYLDLLSGPQYLYPIRTVFVAEKDHVFMESDFTGAELAVMAWISGDPAMIEHVRRNALAESDPDYYDIHSHVAVQAFKLDCEPTKKGLASIHKKHLRVAAKAIAFGVPYGRGAAAIARQCRADGVPITDDEAVGLVESYFSMYPGVQKFLETCKGAQENPGFVKSPYNRYRRFLRDERAGYVDKSIISSQKREACNAPIQSTVADAVNVAMYNLLRYRFHHPELRYKIVMQIHDALLLQVHKDDAAFVYNKLMPFCMVEDNPVPVLQSDGSVVEHHFAIESDMSYRWGEELTDAIAKKELGVSLDYLMQVRD